MSRSDSRSSTYVETKRSTRWGTAAASGSPPVSATAKRRPCGRIAARASATISGLWSTALQRSDGCSASTRLASLAWPQPNSTQLSASAKAAIERSASTAGPPYPPEASRPPMWPLRAKPSYTRRASARESVRRASNVAADAGHAWAAAARARRAERAGIRL